METSSEIDMQVIYLMGSLAMTVMTAGIIIFIFLFQRKIFKRNLEIKQIEDMLQKQELSTAYKILEGQDIERKRIAQDIHDNVGNIMVTLKMYADLLIKKKDIAEKERMAGEILKLAVMGGEQYRNISHSLHSDTFGHFGLSVALKELFDTINNSGTVTAILNIQLEVDLSSEESRNLYRIVQELVNNTLKHASASQIKLEINTFKGDTISMVYEDNGKGFQDEELKENTLGIKGIESRVSSMLGDVKFESVPGKGLTVLIEIPHVEHN